MIIRLSLIIRSTNRKESCRPIVSLHSLQEETLKEDERHTHVLYRPTSPLYIRQHIKIGLLYTANRNIITSHLNHKISYCSPLYGNHHHHHHHHHGVGKGITKDADRSRTGETKNGY